MDARDESVPRPADHLVPVEACEGDISREALAEIRERAKDPSHLMVTATGKKRVRPARDHAPAAPWTTLFCQMPSLEATAALVAAIPDGIDLGYVDQAEYWVEVFIDDDLLDQRYTTDHPYTRLADLTLRLGGRIEGSPFDPDEP
ncbi:MAG: hypothetical protein M3140_07865 [Actinomycetota bacterium]|nr:hypothetical protein [Actinomycetota bacterium]